MRNRQKIQHLGLLLVMLCPISLIIGQNEYQSIMESVFPSEGSGGSAIVVKAGKVVYHGSAGTANLELGIPAHRDHRFRIGSITKQFTSVSILQLMEAGKLDLQDEITKYLPDYPTNGKTITIEHLLTHTSGIKSYTSLQNVMEKEVRTDYSPQELTAFFKDEPMDFDPGEEFRYNNSGYFLLGMIIEKISGESYESYLEKNIFKPLGLTEMAYDMPEKILKNRIPGYANDNDGKIANADFLSMTIPYAAGSLLGTVEDLYKWNKAVHAGKLISLESLKNAHTAYKTNNGESVGYGYGWSVGDFFGHPSVGHGGGINGFLTASRYIAKEDLFIAVFSNCTCIDSDGPADRMAAVALGKSTEYKEVDMSIDELEQYTGVFLIEEPDDKRAIYLKDGELVSSRKGGAMFALRPYGNDKFFYPDSRTTLHYERDGNGKIMGQISTPAGGEPTHAKRTDESLPSLKGIAVPEEILEQHVGRYKFEIGFELIISIENGELMGEMVGQSKEKLTARSSHKFEVPALGAQLTFEEGQPSPTLKINQDGQEMVGVRK